MQPVHAELMLHGQVSRQKFSLVVLPVAHMGTQRQLRTLEMTLIQRWNPSLNFPLIVKKRELPDEGPARDGDDQHAGDDLSEAE